MDFLAAPGLPLWHPGDALPHPPGFEIPPLLFWTMAVITATLALWIAWDVRRAGAERQSRTVTLANKPSDETSTSEQLIVGRPRTGQNRVAAAVAPPPARIDPPYTGTASVEPRRAWLNPARLLAATLGIGLGIVATERARQVESLATLVRSDNAAQVSRLVLAFAVLLLIGGSLSLSAPRAAALLFAAAGVLALFLALAPNLANRLRWWDAAFVLQPWTSFASWSGGCVLLTVITWFSATYQPRNPWRGRRQS